MEPEENITKTATKMTTLADGSSNINNDGTDADGNKGTNDNDGNTTNG